MKFSNYFFWLTGASFDDEKVAVYKFSAVENNNEEVSTNDQNVSAKTYKISKESKNSEKKFRIDAQTDRASIFMQFLVLYNRNFKASIRNTVSDSHRFINTFSLSLCSCNFSHWFICSS